MMIVEENMQWHVN